MKSLHVVYGGMGKPRETADVRNIIQHQLFLSLERQLMTSMYLRLASSLRWPIYFKIRKRLRDV